MRSLRRTIRENTMSADNDEHAHTLCLMRVFIHRGRGSYLTYIICRDKCLSRDRTNVDDQERREFIYSSLYVFWPELCSLITNVFNRWSPLSSVIIYSTGRDRTPSAILSLSLSLWFSEYLYSSSSISRYTNTAKAC